MAGRVPDVDVVHTLQQRWPETETGQVRHRALLQEPLPAPGGEAVEQTAAVGGGRRVVVLVQQAVPTIGAVVGSAGARILSELGHVVEGQRAGVTAKNAEQRRWRR